MRVIAVSDAVSATVYAKHMTIGVAEEQWALCTEYDVKEKTVNSFLCIRLSDAVAQAMHEAALKSGLSSTKGVVCGA